MTKQTIIHALFRVLCIATVINVSSAYSMQERTSKALKSGAEFFLTDPEPRREGNSRAEQLRRVRQGLRSDDQGEQSGNPYALQSTEEIIVGGVKEQCRECQRQCVDCCFNLKAQTVSFISLCFRSCNYCVDHLNYYVIDDRDYLMSDSDSD